MKGFFTMFKDSAKEMVTLKGICLMGMLIAVHLFIGTFASIPIGSTIKISFSFLALAAIGMLLGPTAGAVAGIITDILGFLFVNKTGGAFHPGFTLVQLLAGLFYGIFLYRARYSYSKENRADILRFFVRCVLCKLCIVIVCNLLLNTYFCSILYGKGFMAMLPGRFIKNAIQFPVDVVLMSIILPAVGVAFDKIMRKKRTAA